MGVTSSSHGRSQPATIRPSTSHWPDWDEDEGEYEPVYVTEFDSDLRRTRPQQQISSESHNSYSSPVRSQYLVTSTTESTPTTLSPISTVANRPIELQGAIRPYISCTVHPPSRTTMQTLTPISTPSTKASTPKPQPKPQPTPPPTTTQQRLSSSASVVAKVNGCPFIKGDKIKVIAISINELKLLANGQKEWNPKTVKYMSKNGIINGISENSEIDVKFEDSRIAWTFENELEVEHRVGDVVELIDSESQVKKLQQGHGEFVPDMKNFLGKKGIVFKVFSDGDLSVTFDGGTWQLNPKCIVSLVRSPKKPRRINQSANNSPIKDKRSRKKQKKSPDIPQPPPTEEQHSFATGDRVKVIAIKYEQLKELQQGHGGWNPRMAQAINKTGIVMSITETKDVNVLFNHSRLSWTFNPLVLRKHYAGDIVKVIKDNKKVKKILDENDKYSPEIMKIRGECGIVMDTDNDGDLIVHFGKQTYILNPSCVMNISELAKSRQKMKEIKKIAKESDEISWRKWISEFIDLDDSQVIPTLDQRKFYTKTETDSNFAYLVDKIRILEKKLTAIEDANNCSICLENSKNVIFLCGHGSCSVCCTNLSVCHMCRKYITYKITIY